ncbi:hypothetical protein TNCV_1368761 [Trichonephila clavipes]|nr:hypothetical protein TNCV_1368761 [Trichonephila clavipes]
MDTNFCVRLRKSVVETYEILKQVIVKHNRERKLLSGIYVFREGWESVEDDKCSVRPPTSCNAENIKMFVSKCGM